MDNTDGCIGKKINKRKTQEKKQVQEVKVQVR